MRPVTRESDHGSVVLTLGAKGVELPLQPSLAAMEREDVTKEDGPKDKIGAHKIDHGIPPGHRPDPVQDAKSGQATRLGIAVVFESLDALRQ